MALMNNCRQCTSKRNVPGDAHIKCVKPDTNMTGSSFGIKNGWFLYPQLFDPAWMTAKCENFEAVKES